MLADKGKVSEIPQYFLDDVGGCNGEPSVVGREPKEFARGAKRRSARREQHARVEEEPHPGF